MRLLCAAFAIFNLNLCRLSFQTAMAFYYYFGLLHALTVCSLVLSIKPLINAASLAVFGFRQRRHARLIAALDDLDAEWAVDLGSGAPVRFSNWRMHIVLAIVSIGTVATRIAEYDGQVLPTPFNFHVATVALPFVQLWALAPVLYFIAIQSALRAFARTLWRAISAPSDARSSPVSLPYFVFLLLRSFFNPSSTLCSLMIQPVLPEVSSSLRRPVKGLRLIWPLDFW